MRKTEVFTAAFGLRIATTLRTTDAAAVDDALILRAEGALMRLSDAIASSYLTHNERSDALWEALA